MAHGAAGNDGTFSIATILVARLIEWEAEERAVEVTDTAAGDAAVSQIKARIDWTARCRGQVMPTGTASQGGVPIPANVIGVAVAIAGLRKAGETALFAATGAVTRFRYTSGGPDGVQEFEAEAVSSEGANTPTWVFT